MSSDVQDKYDALMLLMTETISSEDYLENRNIFVAPPLKESAFIKQIIKPLESQITGKASEYILPKQGLYSRRYTGQAVHYYAIRERSYDGRRIIGNGYPTSLNARADISVRLDAQENKGHGFCQIYALMFFYKVETKLSTQEKRKDRYAENIHIALKWADHWTKQKLYIFNIRSLQRRSNQNKKDAEVLKYFFKQNVVSLHDIVRMLRHKKYKKYLEAWHDGTSF
tara:strand:+ start:8813 stop:9490 length:678 start_codon:yes stop_codon:yes gene_type:complete